MKQLKSKYEIVKNVVEMLSDIDMSSSSKAGKIPYIRYVYYKLCEDFDKENLNISECSRLLNRPHTQGLYAIKKFNQYEHQECFSEMFDLYNACKSKIIKELCTAEDAIKMRLRISRRLNKIL